MVSTEKLLIDALRNIADISDARGDEASLDISHIAHSTLETVKLVQRQAERRDATSPMTKADVIAVLQNLAAMAADEDCTTGEIFGEASAAAAWAETLNA